MKVLFFLIYMSLAAYASANDSFGPAIKLNPPLMAGGGIFSVITIAPDSQRVVFTAEVSANSPAELYSASLSGGNTTRLTPNLMPGSDVLSGNGERALISADSASVVYRADQITDNVVELFSVPIQGGEQKRLNDDLLGNNRIPAEFSISSNSARVTYVAQNASGQSELFSVPIDGGVPVRLNADLPSGGDVLAGNGRISPNGSYVVYVADQNTNNISEIFSVPIEGGAITRLNEDLVEDGDVVDRTDSFQISSDSQRVVYRADSNQAGVTELFSVPIGGGTNTRLNPDLVSNGDVRSGVKLSPDGQYVIYRADQNKDNQVELFSVPITGGTAVRLNDDLVNGGSVNFDFEISADSQYVIYLADQNRDELFELFSVPIAGGAAIRLNPDLVSQGDVSNGRFAISADSQWVVYRADQNRDGLLELFSVPIAGGQSTRLNPDLVSQGDVTTFRISPDSKRVAYRADQNRDELFELFSVPILGGMSTRLNPDLVSQGDVFSFDFSPDGNYIVYQALQDNRNRPELFSVEVLSERSDEICFPIKSKANKVVVVCL